MIAFSGGVYNNALAASLFITQAQGGVQLTVVDSGKVGVSAAFAVNPAVLSSFGVGAIGGQVADTAFNVVITAYDVYGNVLSTGPNNFNGAGNTVQISDSTGTVTPVVSGAFTAGVRTELVQVTLAQSNVQITVVDSVGGLGSGVESGVSNIFNVAHGTLASFTVEASSGGNIPTQIVSSAFTIRVTARDAFGNVVTAFNGAGNTVSISDSTGRSCRRCRVYSRRVCG